MAELSIRSIRLARVSIPLTMVHAGSMYVIQKTERTVIELRFGIKDGRPRTLDIVGNELGVTRERARQIEAQALEKLRRSNGNLRGEGDF